MYHTWGWVVGNPFRPISSISPVPKWTLPKNDKYFVSAQNSCLIYHYSSSTLISEIFIKIREGAFRDVPCKLNIKHNNCTEYTPTANAISERYVQTLINCIKSYCSMVSKDWEKHLRNCVFSINNSVHEVMNYSPIFLLMGYKPQSFIENQFDVKEYLNSESSTDQLMYSWITVLQEANENLLKYQNKSKENYAIKCRLPPFALGSLVWLEDQTPAPQGLRSKLRRKFIGPFCIVKLTSDKTYWLVNSTKVSSIRDFKRADAKRLKHYSGKDKKIAKRHQKLLKLINENFYEKVKDIKDLPKHSIKYFN
jgi:hypothetical protein